LLPNEVKLRIVTTYRVLWEKGEAMKTAFDKPMSDEWTSRALAHTVYGGADFGECTTTAGRVAIGDADSWYRE
jgi:hypothetical protein